MMRWLALLGLLLTSSTAVAALPPDAVPLDLSKGTLAQSRCKTAIGCGHPVVSLDASSFESSSTATSPAQHVLTLAVPAALDGSFRAQDLLSLTLDFVLDNPSGHANNLVCASVVEHGKVQQRCGGAYERTGRVILALTRPPDKIFLHFALMPFSAGHGFIVKNVRLVRGHLQEAPKGDLDLTRGRLQQPGCETPIGCRHPLVRLTADTFSSIVPAGGAGQSTSASDVVTVPPGGVAPPKGAALSLELPLHLEGQGSRVLQFRYRLDRGQTQGDPDGRIVVTAKGRTVASAVIESPGKGVASFSIPATTSPVDSVTFSFVRGAALAPAIFEVADLALAPHASALAPLLGVTERPTCDWCDLPETRADPCGPLLSTFWVEAADARVGQGIRCVSPDLRAWYGEGWWIDRAYGRYRHLGAFTDFRLGLPRRALGVDFGVQRTLSSGTVLHYGVRGARDLAVETIGLFRWRVSSADSLWNEIWTFVPKSELLPEFFGSLPWDGGCGLYGLDAWTTLGNLHFDEIRCAIPLDRVLFPPFGHGAPPLVWYGSSYLNQTSRDVPDAFRLTGDLSRTHLGWFEVPGVPPAPFMFSGAADRCLLEFVGGCTSMDDITIEVLGPGPSPYPIDTVRGSYWSEHFLDSQGLYLLGPETWHEVSRTGETFGHIWEKSAALPDTAALETPTPICIEDSGCP